MIVFHFFFFFNDTATTEIYTLSLHDALPISMTCRSSPVRTSPLRGTTTRFVSRPPVRPDRLVRRVRSVRRSEEHTSELQSRLHLVCRLLLEKKKKQNNTTQQTLHESANPPRL